MDIISLNISSGVGLQVLTTSDSALPLHILLHKATTGCTKMNIYSLSYTCISFVSFFFLYWVHLFMSFSGFGEKWESWNSPISRHSWSVKGVIPVKMWWNVCIIRALKIWTCFTSVEAEIYIRKYNSVEKWGQL